MDLPDSQPFFTEDIAESQPYLEKRQYNDSIEEDLEKRQYNDSIEEGNACSQSILFQSKIRRTLNTVDSLTLDLESELGDCSKQARRGSFDSPIKETLSKTNFYFDSRHQEQEIINIKKKEKTSDNEKERSSDMGVEKESDDEKEIVSDEEKEIISDEEKEVNGYKEEEKTRSVMCIDCIFDKDLDKRNYYFGNLLIGELQFLPPCMRSEAYINILKYIDSLKHKHRNKMNN